MGDAELLERLGRREPLEAYPLDSMSMVGSMVKTGRQYALLKVDNLLYQVKSGDYLGQNYGKITKITEGFVSLEVADNVVILVQKQAVNQLLPKGTLKDAQ